MDIIIKTSDIQSTDLCGDCGHIDADHDFGLGGGWCEGNGTHSSEWGKRNFDKLCQCEQFKPIDENTDWKHLYELSQDKLSSNQKFHLENREKWSNLLENERDKVFQLENELKDEQIKSYQLENKSSNYQELWDMACEQIAQACVMLGVDPEEAMADGWTLLERCREIKNMGVLPLKLECPECKWAGAWSYPCTIRVGDPDPNYVRCVSCGHIWSNQKSDTKIILTENNK